jgi:hypothetical protein
LTDFLSHDTVTPMTRDPEDFPVAIIPTRPAGIEPLKDRWDTLARRIGDPLVTLFLLQAPDQPPDLRFKAAAELLPYRHRKLKPHEDPADPTARTQVNVQINLSPSSAVVSLPSSVISSDSPLD